MSKKPHFLSKNGDFSPFLQKKKKSGRVTFEPLWSLNCMPNFRKILRAVSEKKRSGTGLIL
jgi:hypothetical protein